jgi:hypothetical protein
MTNDSSRLFQDVMQVCRNGHVVTDRLRSSPERSRHNCERCGAVTLHACATCGQELPGAIIVPGLEPLGARRAPLFCSRCGADFPWQARSPDERPVAPGATLEAFCHRLPQVIRQLRQRWSTRPTFAIQDEHDLEDLVRSLLPLYFTDIRCRSRTPSYASSTRTDLLLQPHSLVVTAKHTGPSVLLAEIEQQLKEDIAFYRAVPECRMLWVYILDLQRHLQEPKDLEALWSQKDERLEVRCVISS